MKTSLEEKPPWLRDGHDIGITVSMKEKMRNATQGIMEDLGNEEDYELPTAGENLQTFNKWGNTELLSMGLKMTPGLPSRGTTPLLTVTIS